MNKTRTATEIIIIYLITTLQSIINVHHITQTQITEIILILLQKN